MTTKPQPRRAAQLIATLHALALALIPAIRIIVNHCRIYPERNTIQSRLNTILQQLLALTARIHPTSLRPLAHIPSPDIPSPQRRLRPASTRPTRPASPNAPLTPARLIERLEHLLQQLEALAKEAGAILNKRIRSFITRARTLAGCKPPLPTQRTWERAG